MDASSGHLKATGLRWVQYILVSAMFITGGLLYSRLPAVIPTHWGFSGEPNQWSPKIYGTWLLPGVALLMTIAFPLLRRIDPKAENYQTFKSIWELIQLAIVAFMAYTYLVQLYATLNPGQAPLVGRYIVFGVGFLFVLIGNFMGKIRQNYFIGLRTPWSLSSPEVWGKSQRFGGWCFVVGGLLMMAYAFLWKAVPFLFFLILTLMVILPVVYSYLAFRSKKIVIPLLLSAFLILSGFAVLMFSVRLLTDEDTWVCQNGVWVQYGHPSGPKPLSECP